MSRKRTDQCRILEFTDCGNENFQIRKNLLRSDTKNMTPIIKLMISVDRLAIIEQINVP